MFVWQGSDIGKQEVEMKYEELQYLVDMVDAASPLLFLFFFRGAYVYLNPTCFVPTDCCGSGRHGSE
jgi:hypothetical protein